MNRKRTIPTGSSLTRRSFLRHAGLGGAAVVGSRLWSPAPEREPLAASEHPS
jgi:hypothetical protein